MGAGNDTFVWNSGRRQRTVEGGAGTTDTLQIVSTGSTNASDSTPPGEWRSGAAPASTVDNVIMDLNDVERVHLHASSAALRPLSSSTTSPAPTSSR